MANKLEEKIIKKFDIDAQTVEGAELAKKLVASIGNPLNIAQYMVDVAIKRDMPEASDLFTWMKDKKLDDSVKAFINAGVKSILAKEHEDVSITAFDGLNLVGHIIKAPNQKRVIIAAHGWRSSWYNDFGPINDFWLDNGSTMLCIEQRGQGLSEGDYMTFGVYERFDVFEWAKWVAEQFGKDVPIYLAGVSMGATSVLMASSELFPENVRGIIADCGFTSPNEIWKHVANDCLHLIYTPGLIEKHCMESLHFSPSTHSAVKSLKKATVPVFLVHGESDSFVPMEMSLKNYDACRTQRELHLFPGADHGFSYYVDPKRYQAKELEFFKRNE